MKPGWTKQDQKRKTIDLRDLKPHETEYIVICLGGRSNRRKAAQTRALL